jgi:sugar lactone lactonase YvrE
MLKSRLSFFVAALMGVTFAATVSAQSGTPAREFFISTIAGIGTFGYSGDGGPALDAKLSGPHGVAADALGNVYIADTYNNVIRKITPAGIISTVAGNGHQGFGGDFGPGTSAELDSPFGVAVDAAGNLYIADSSNERIRKLNTAGTITTYAGNGTDGYSGDNGPATNAELNFPTDLAVDSAGNLYIADFDNARIRKVTPVGTITTVAGNGVIGYSGDGGAAVNAELNIPRGVATDSAGNLYIADSGNKVIRKVDIGGIITTIAGGPAGASNACPGPNVSLNFPTGIVVDPSGNLYFADPSEEAICQLTPDGTLSLAAGDGQFGHLGDGGPAIFAELEDPESLAADSSGRIDVADYAYIRRLTLDASPIAATPTISLASGSYNSLQYATLGDTTPNAVIHYTLDGSTPTSISPVFQLPIYIGGSITLKAVAIATGYASSEVAIGTYDVTLPSATAPTFSPSPAKYLGSVAVTIGDTTPAAVIHYTLDGSTPLSSSPVYTGPLVLYATTTVKAIATAGGYWKSKDVAAQFVVVPYAPTPVIQPGFGYYPAGTLISITDPNPHATIRYTTDGSTPTTASRMYTTPFPLTGPMVVKAIAIATNDLTSLVAVEQYGLQ